VDKKQVALAIGHYPNISPHEKDILFHVAMYPEKNHEGWAIFKRIEFESVTGRATAYNSGLMSKLKELGILKCSIPKNNKSGNAYKVVIAGTEIHGPYTLVMNTIFKSFAEETIINPIPNNQPALTSLYKRDIAAADREAQNEDTESYEEPEEEEPEINVLGW